MTHSILTMTDTNELFFDIQQKTDKQHILDNPDTYIGSVESIDSHMWVVNEDRSKIVERNIQYTPGLYKLFDECIVNCSDHSVRMKSKVDTNVDNALPVSHIDVTIDPDGTIHMVNDGNGIDVAQKDGVWIPELIFGHLRTSTNYNKDEQKIVGGKNGFGFKLVLIWSTYGRVETVDHIRGLKYIQEYKDNLDNICAPSVTKCKNKPYTKITFKPDYARLGIDGLTPDMVALLTKRVYDISAITNKTVKVKCNNELVPVKNFEQYINMYIGDKSSSPRVYEEANERWEYAVALTPCHEFTQVSFVNGINTSKGGKHVEYILNQIVRKLVDFIEKKKKTKVNPNTIKEQLILFLRCDIVNPAFDSQTKDYMNTPSIKFGSKCEVSEKFIEKVAKMGVMDTALELTEVKETKAAKKTDGAKTKSIRGIPKLTDANWAGTNNSAKCMLILCEGDSAKAGILSGLNSEDRNSIGVYPLKGKLMNVRGEPVKKIADNKEIIEIKKILGLVTGHKYATPEDARNLRYGQVVFMTDQDLDGSHIKGLAINLFFCEWPTLAQLPGFIGFMNTPILKAHKGCEVMNFYNDGEFAEWNEHNDIKGWQIKYYKGLGTSTGKEFREYFNNRKIIEFEFTGTASEHAIDMVFNKKKADDRKVWLNSYDRRAYLDTNKNTVSYEEFVNRELIHFSKYDCDRSIPNLMDGLKISQRKIVYASFKMNLVKEIKVAQFSGYVSKESGYHHGEASLNAAIVGMAQNFVGANNINLLTPNGQFGTRLQGGKDSASERYIFTQLNKLTRTLFPRPDDAVLEYLNDDGMLVEPIYYAPIVPMILVNGAKGIGTGFSTEIMCYNPLQIIEYLQNKLRHIEDDIEFIPYYEGFKGSITKLSADKFLIRGIYETVDTDIVRVTELPVGYWTEDFKDLLEHWINPGEDKDGNKIAAIVKDFKDMSTDTNVDFTITFVDGKLNELVLAKGDHGCNGLEKLLKLYITNSSTNMHVFNADDTLQKFDTVSDIIDAYYAVRLKLYQTRKEHMVRALEHDLMVLSTKVRYIQENINGTIDLRKKKKEEVVIMLQSKGYETVGDDPNYQYLTKMPMDSVTEENAEKLAKERANKIVELNTVQSTTVNQMWLTELDTLKTQYLEYKETRANDMIENTATPSTTNKSTKKVVTTKKLVKKQK